jgi:hypothetical protein
MPMNSTKINHSIYLFIFEIVIKKIESLSIKNGIN